MKKIILGAVIVGAVAYFVHTRIEKVRIYQIGFAENDGDGVTDDE